MMRRVSQIGVRHTTTTMMDDSEKYYVISISLALSPSFSYRLRWKIWCSKIIQAETNDQLWWDFAFCVNVFVRNLYTCHDDDLFQDCCYLILGYFLCMMWKAFGAFYYMCVVLNDLKRGLFDYAIVFRFTRRNLHICYCVRMGFNINVNMYIDI